MKDTQDSVLDLLVRKYCKRTLNLLEEKELFTPENKKLLRKIVLDAFNDMKRDLESGAFVK